MYAVAIVGGGIVGLATAMALSQENISPLILVEAEERLAAHQTGRNSGVIHSGLYYSPGSLKAENCIRGRDLLYRFCQEQGISHAKCGKLVIAVTNEDLPRLRELELRGIANGLLDIRKICAAEIAEIEPQARGKGALWIPETGIVDYTQVAEKFAAIFRQRGGEIRTGFRVRAIALRADEIVLQADTGEVLCRNLINCAGLHSDRIAHMCRLKPGLRIVPFRGEYFRLTNAGKKMVRNLIYPVPDPRFPFLGVHFTRKIDGSIEAGPNAVLAFRREGYSKTDIALRDMASYLFYGGFWKMAAHYWKTGLAEMYRSYWRQGFLRALQRLVPNVNDEDIQPGGSGVRAQALATNGKLLDDFCILEAARMIHVLNAPSPAATASISIGQTIAAIARRNFTSA